MWGQVPRVAHPLPPGNQPPPSGSVKATSGAAAAGGGNPGGEEGVGARAEDIRTCVPGISAYPKTKNPMPLGFRIFIFD